MYVDFLIVYFDLIISVRVGGTGVAAINCWAETHVSRENLSESKIASS